MAAAVVDAGNMIVLTSDNGTTATWTPEGPVSAAVSVMVLAGESAAPGVTTLTVNGQTVFTQDITDITSVRQFKLMNNIQSIALAAATNNAGTPVARLTVHLR